jgi:hypothetical protein
MTTHKQQDINDTRVYELIAYREPITWLLKGDIVLRLTQRDLRIIIKHTQYRNNYITNKLKGFIQEIDDATGKPTDWDSVVPHTNNITFS